MDDLLMYSYLQDEDIGELFQDETNMAALLLYRQGNSEEYNMVSLPASHWSSYYITVLSLVERFIVMKYFHSDAKPALLGDKEPAQGTQSPC